MFRPDPYVLDGRNANNGWLQELPRPLSKVTWDNVAYISPATAEARGIPISRAGNADQDLLEIEYQGRKARIPVWVMPGTADDVVVVHFGYGRKKAGRVGTGVGHDVFGLRSSTTPWFGGGAKVTKTGDTYFVASTQNHFAWKAAIRCASSTRKSTGAIRRSSRKWATSVRPTTMSLYRGEHAGGVVTPTPFEYKGQKWGMAIDLNACTGCSACVVACVAENNIPVVGKAQVGRSREMHWLRVDTYFEGDAGVAVRHLSPAGALHAVRERRRASRSARWAPRCTATKA